MKRPEWDEYFLDMALLVSRRSTCLRRRYGSVIVKDNVIVSTGYNGAARNAINCIDRNICYREQLKIPSGQRYELCRAVHAEANAIINGNSSEIYGSTIYICGTNVKDNTIANSTPCLMCARMIVNARISKIVFYDSNKNICVLSNQDLVNLIDKDIAE